MNEHEISLISPTVACKRLGVGRATLDRIRKRDTSFPSAFDLPGNRIGFDRTEFNDWLVSKRMI